MIAAGPESPPVSNARTPVSLIRLNDVGIEFDRPSESRLGTSIVDSMMTDTMGAGVHRTSAPWGAAG